MLLPERRNPGLRSARSPQGTDGEARRKGASPASTGEERQSGMLNPVTVTGSVRTLSADPDSPDVRWEETGTLEPIDGLTALVRHRRANDVSAQAIEEERLAKLAECTDREGRTRKLDDRRKVHQRIGHYGAHGTGYKGGRKASV